MKRLACITLLVVSLLSCGHKKLEPVAYRQWLNNPENGLTIERTIGDFIVTAAYRSTQFMALKELENYQYVNLRLDNKDKKTEVLKTALQHQQQYYERLQYLTTTLPEDIYLVEDGDTLPCRLHHYERTYQMSSFCDVSLVFENRHKTTTDKVLVFDDRMFGFGRLQFRFEQDDLNNIPQLTTY